MTFHTSVVIYSCDPSRVWRMLEQRLRAETIEIVRAGKVITLSGLGPGAVSMNKDDVTVLTIKEFEDAVFIAADGVFDGTYLGDQATQETAVCSKLEAAFEDVQKQIDLEEMQNPEARGAAAKQYPIERVAGKPAGPGKEIPAAPDLAARVVPASTMGRSEPVHPAVVDAARMHRVADVAPVSYRQFGFFAATIIGVAIVATGVNDVQRLAPRDSSTVAVNAPVAPISPVPAKPSGSADVPVTSAAAPTSSNDLAAVAAASAIRFSDTSSDPVTWLGHWERAMRTRDAAAQSSFYADSVERYQGQLHLSKADVQQKKQAAIAGRRGLWTVKVEGAVVQKQTKDEVDIQLVKHVIAEPVPSQISEQFVQTELHLKRLNGAWKIVSEEDLAESPTPLDPMS
jgi:uncharacterized protein (DUF952 family)